MRYRSDGGGICGVRRRRVEKGRGSRELIRSLPTFFIEQITTALAVKKSASPFCLRAGIAIELSMIE